MTSGACLIGFLAATRRTRCLPLLIFILPLVGASVGPTAAQDAKPPAARNWLVACSNQTDPARMQCTVSQNIVNQQSNQRIALLQLLREGSTDRIDLHMPFGLDIGKGVTLSIDGKGSQKIAFDTADRNGLLATFPLTKDMLTGFKAGSVVSLKVANLQGNPIEIQVDLNGFSAAYAFYEKASTL